MSPPKQQQQFTVPLQLTKSKIILKNDKIIRKQNLRNKVLSLPSYPQANIPKMTIDSQNQDIQQQQQLIAFIAKEKPINGGNHSIKNITPSSILLMMLVLSSIKHNNFQQEVKKLALTFNNPQNYHILQRKDTLKVLFRQQTLIDSQQYHNLIVYELNPYHIETVDEEEQQPKYICLNGQSIELFVSSPIQTKFPPNVSIWAFRNPSKQSRIISDNDMILPENYLHPQKLTFCAMQDSSSKIQLLLKLQKQQHSQQTIDHQIKLWTIKYREIFEQNDKALQILASRIEENIDQRKLQQQLKERQQEIVILTQKQLLWSQILLLFKKGHSDKTQQLLNDALQIRTIMQMNMKQSLKKKKSTSQQKLKSLFQTDCKICFSTQSDEKINKVFYCDGCNTSFHQICYGISKAEADQILSMEKFYCDVCAYYIETKPALSSKRSISSMSIENQGKVTQKAQTKQKKPCCQICCKSNFPMKQINGHFYHVTCLFMFDFGQVRDYKISTKEGLSSNDIFEEVIENEMSSGLCEFCLKYQGMKFKCRQKECSKWYHPICGYLHGIYFNLKRKFRKLQVSLYCYQHQLCQQRNIINQIYIRRFFCDYKKTSNLNEQDFEEEYGKEVREMSKERSKETGCSLGGLLMRKPIKKDKTTIASGLGQPSTTINTTSVPSLPSSLPSSLKKTDPSPQPNTTNQPNLNLSNPSSVPFNQQFDTQRNNDLFLSKMDHNHFLQQDLSFQ